jgi:CRP/FNR family cyclic AMP-dependent transcriptional regulator
MDDGHKIGENRPMALGITLNEEFIKKYGKKFPPAALLAREGEKGDTMFIITEGKVNIIKETTQGEKVLAVLKDGDIFGEMAVMGMQNTRAATVRAMTETSVLELNKAAFTTLIKKSPEVALNVITTLTERIRDTNGRVAALMQDNKYVRLAAYLNHLANDRGIVPPQKPLGKCFTFNMEAVCSALNINIPFLQEFMVLARQARLIGINGEWCWTPYPEYIIPFAEYLSRNKK